MALQSWSKGGPIHHESSQPEAQESTQQPGIEKLEFGGLDHPRQAIGRPGRHTPHQEELLQQGDVARHRLAVEAETGTQLGGIAELAAHLNECREQLGKALQLIDGGDVANVALQDGVEVTARPCLTAAFAAAMQGLGIAAGEHPPLQGLAHLGGCLLGRW